MDPNTTETNWAEIGGKMTTWEAVQEYTHKRAESPWRPASLESPPVREGMKNTLLLAIVVGRPWDLVSFNKADGKYYDAYHDGDPQWEAEVLYWMEIPPNPPEMTEFFYGGWRWKKTA